MRSDTPLLRAEHLVKDYPIRRGGLIRHQRGMFRAVDDVSFDLLPGRTVAIVGESGSGKSTTARIVAKLIEPTSGRLEFQGQDMTSSTERELRKYRSNVQVVFQDPYSSLNPRHTVEQIVSAPLRYQHIGKAGEYRGIVKDLMTKVGLNPDHSTRHPWQFSGGQAQRISIARALAVNPKVVICDEAVSALDVSVQAQVLELLRDLQAESGLSYIFISHDLAVVHGIADHVVVMHDAKVMESGPRDLIFTSPQAEYTQQLLAAVPRINPAWEAARLARRGAQ